MYDCIIIGDGIAALSAVLNLQIRNKKILLMGSEDGSNKIKVSHEINNYIGLEKISGANLMNTLISHVKSMGVSFSNLKANQVYAMGDHFMVSDKANDEHLTKTVIVATGVVQQNPIEGEMEFLGRGVSYCATCDAGLYKNKTVAVIGQNEEAIHEANFLATLCKKVYFVPIKKLQSKLDDIIEIKMKKIVAIKGMMKANSLVLGDETLEVDGVFVLKDSVDPSYLIPGVATENNHIKVDVNMKTNIKGLFACGDCVGLPYALSKASGQGQTAGLNVVSYLDGGIINGY